MRVNDTYDATFFEVMRQGRGKSDGPGADISDDIFWHICNLPGCRPPVVWAQPLCITTIFSSSLRLLASLHDHDPDMELASEYLFFEAGAAEAVENPLPLPGVVITDKDALDAVATAQEDTVPNSNARPLLVIRGWDKKSIFTNTGPVDPNASNRYSFLLEDLVDYNNGVYRPVFVSHNSRASMVSIGKDLGQKLHGTYLNQPGKIKGLPADPENPDSGSFSFVNTLGYSYGGLISRSYQAVCQSVMNMNIIGIPNHSTYGVVFSLFSDSLVKRLVRVSPGTADLLAYDDTKESASCNNPRLCMLNRNPDALPDQSMTLVAGTDSSWWSDILLEGENDRVVPVSSVFCRTSSPDDGGASPSNHPLRKVYIYDPAADTWGKGPSMDYPRSTLAAVATPDAKIYAIGGTDVEAYRGLETLNFFLPENMDSFFLNFLFFL